MSTPDLDQTLVATDGTCIAYGSTGRGPALMLTNGLTTDGTFWKYLGPIWAQHHRVIYWDLPGHGRSDPARSPRMATVEAQPELMREILDRLEVDRAIHVGWSTGCQSTLEMYRQFPERCAALALLFGGFERVLETTQFPLPGAWFAHVARALPERAFELMCQGLSRFAAGSLAIPLGRKLGLIGPRTREQDIRSVLAHLGRVDPVTLREMMVSLQAHSARAVLSRVEVPLLIFGGDIDPFAPAARVGIPMHQAAPRSEFVRLPEGTHTALLDEPEVIARAVEALALEAFKPA